MSPSSSSGECIFSQSENAIDITPKFMVVKRADPNNMWTSRLVIVRDVSGWRGPPFFDRAWPDLGLTQYWNMEYPYVPPCSTYGARVSQGGASRGGQIKYETVDISPANSRIPRKKRTSIPHPAISFVGASVLVQTIFTSSVVDMSCITTKGTVAVSPTNTPKSDHTRGSTVKGTSVWSNGANVWIGKDRRSW
jgi:hypothetical protein